MRPDTLLPIVIASSSMLLLANGCALAWQRWNERNTEELFDRFQRLVRGESLPVRPKRRDLRNFLSRFAARRFDETKVDEEVRVLLAQAGYPGKEPVAIFAALRALLPVIVTSFSVSFYFLGGGGFDLGLALTVYGSFVVAYLAPKKVLASKANARTTRIRDEVTALTHLMRVLYDCGLSTEQAFQVMSKENAHVLPDISREVAELMRLVSAGSELPRALREVSERLQIPELTDLFGMIRQIDQYGGAVQEPLLRFADLLEDRERTRMQESISKLSAKLTAVMVGFLLPALLCFIAGPGILSVIRALSEMK